MMIASVRQPASRLALVLCSATILFSQSESKPQTQTTTAAGEIYRNASPAVVLIETYNEKGEVSAAGSGFIISADGKILTNYHVVAHTKQATVRLANNDAYDSVDVLDIDKRKDIALIKIKAVSLPFLSLGQSSPVDVGDAVFSLSTPLGILQNTLSNGIVSGIRSGDGYRYFQITAPISHGSSGGPIFNSKGEVVGIAAATISEGQNLNFAIPIDYAKGMIASPSAPRSLSAIYEPEPPSPDQRQPADLQKTKASADEKTQEYLKQYGIVPYLEHQFGLWTLEDSKVLLGDPHGHRFGAGDPIPEIWAYDDPTKFARQIELVFDGRTKKLHDFYIYPINVTWNDCKTLWGNNVRTQKNADGTRFHLYKDRHLNVLVSPNDTVISFGVYTLP